MKVATAISAAITIPAVYILAVSDAVWQSGIAAFTGVATLGATVMMAYLALKKQIQDAKEAIVAREDKLAKELSDKLAKELSDKLVAIPVVEPYTRQS